MLKDSKQVITPHKHGLEAAIAAHQTGASAEELLFQSAAWPDTQPVEPDVVAVGESAFIVDEIIMEVLDELQRAQPKRGGNPTAVNTNRPKTVIECQKQKKVDCTKKEDEKAWINFDNSKEAKKSQHDADRIEAMERQLWALFQRLEDLERFGQNGRRF